METNSSNINVQEIQDKITYDKILSTIREHSAPHDMSFAGDFLLAVSLNKEDALLRLIGTMQKAPPGEEAIFNVVSVNASLVIVQGPEVYTEIRAAQRSKYCTLYFRVWAPTGNIRKDFKTWVTKIFDGELIQGTICGLRWAYASKHGLGTTYLEELLSDVVVDESYPSIIKQFGSLSAFAENYINSDESVLVLQGPPGTGKSRLIRYIMAKLVEMRKIDKDRGGDIYDESPSDKSLVLYTSDTDTLKGDELFAHFMVSDEVMFVVEDADNMLRSRHNGNDHLHRFLTVSDGIVRNVGRKVVFTTNLPNMRDIDEALLRPGRCFAGLSLANLTQEEAKNLAKKLSPKINVEDDITKRFQVSKDMSLAEVYKLVKGHK